MNTRVKVGDLAAVVDGDPETPQNIGIICKVLEYVGNSELGWFSVDDAFLVESVGRPFVFFDAALAMTNQQAQIQASCLRPISGIPDTDTIDTDTPVDAEVLT